MPKTGKLQRAARRVAPDYSRMIAEALREELGDSHRAIKIVMKWTGASERSAKYWLSGARGPSGENLVLLARNSPRVLRAVLELCGHEQAIGYLHLREARDSLSSCMKRLDELLGESSKPAY